MNGPKDIIGTAIAGAIALCAPLALAGYGIYLAVSWMEQRFGAPVAAAAAFSILGCIILGAGVVLNQRSTKHTFDMIADLRASDAEIRRADTSVERERARFEREQFVHQARLTTIDLHRVNQLATQQARLLVDTERERWNLQQQAQQQPAQIFAMADDNDGAGPTYYDE
jgi:hypothetical protein